MAACFGPTLSSAIDRAINSGPPIPALSRQCEVFVLQGTDLLPTCVFYSPAGGREASVRGVGSCRGAPYLYTPGVFNGLGDGGFQVEGATGAPPLAIKI